MSTLTQAKPAGSMPNGSFPITNETQLRSAIKLNGHSASYSREQVRTHIRRRASALGLTKLIPEEWNSKATTQEAPVEQPVLAQENKTLSATLLLEQVAKPVIIQEASLPDGVMRIKAPFYVGGSVSRAPGFSKKIIWQESVLPKIIEKANAKLAAGQQKITSYARHAHAIAGDDLPIATVVAVEQEGGVGFATLDIYPVKPRGEHVQTLVQAGALTAMSLRTNDYRLVAGKLDGESVLLCEDMDLQGLDFAPDGPAQPTYGIKVLNQEAVIEATPDESTEDVAPAPPTPTKEINTLTEQDKPLTLEEVRTAYPDFIEQIEAPLRQENAELKKQNDSLRQADSIRQRDVAIAEFAAKTSNPEEFSKVLTELCQEEKVTSKDGVNALVAPLLVAELERSRQTPAAPPAKPKRDQLLELFGAPTAKPVGIAQEEKEEDKPALVQEDAAEMTAAGLVVPEGW